MDELGGELAKRLQDERALEHPRMWQRQVRRVQDHVGVSEKVEIERAGPPPKLSHAAGRRLESTQCAVECVRSQARPQVTDTVQVLGLWRSERGRSPERRHGDELRFG